MTAAVHAAIAALFQFTPLREGRLCARRKARKSSRFQFTPLREGRPPTFTPDAEKLRISSHAPPRGATVIQALRNIVTRISIHAPPRGATFLRSLCCSNFYQISIHAPPRGATGQNAEERRGTYFNSRPSARGDRAIPGEGQHVVISIHAPPRGATETGYAKLKLSTFQFTPLREGRLACFKQSDNIILFQFTPLREGRPLQPAYLS